MEKSRRSRRLPRLELAAIATLLLGAAPAAPGKKVEKKWDEPRIEAVDGKVRLKKSGPLPVGATIPVPYDLDLSTGSVELFWSKSKVRVLAEGLPLKLVRADSRGVRLRASDVRVQVPPGQGVQVRYHPAGRTPKTFLKALSGNTGALALGICQTVVNVGPGATATMLLDRGALEVVVQAESGSVEVVTRDGARALLLAGQRVTDGCAPTPEEIGLDEPEERPPLTPFQP